jgi:hypothetical protein
MNVSLEAGGGATALGYVNVLRTRANGATKCRRFNYDFHIRRELENCIGKDTEEQIWFVLENSLEEVIYGLGKVGFLEGTNTI